MQHKNQIKIALTGGGTAGHVIPHFALLPYFEKEGWQVFYIGSAGMEKALVEESGLAFYCILAGKLRRYFSWQNFLDFFKVGLGFLQSLAILLREKPSLLFSKGGFVSVPVALAAWCLRIPVITHESDLTPGLATKIISKVARKVLFSFPETERYLPPGKAHFAGIPIRSELFEGSQDEGFRLCNFERADERPVILLIGGSLGAKRLNEALQESLPTLLDSYRVVHITGKGKSIGPSHAGYQAFEYVKNELKHLFAMADVVVSRAGANSLFELLALRKPMLLIPLESGSRGDQVHNAQCFASKQWAEVLREGRLNASTLVEGIRHVLEKADEFRERQAQSKAEEAGSKVLIALKESLA